MTQLILPEIQATGAWKLKSPYQNLLTEGIWYTCIAVRKLEDYINRGIDVFEEYYNTPYMVPKERYEQDLAGGACIIIVRNASGDVKAFPNTYLESFPAGGGVAARRARPRADPQGAHAQSADRARCRRLHPCARHPRLLRRGSRQPRQRGGALRRAQQQAPGGYGRLRTGQGQDHDGGRAPQHGDDRRGKEEHRLPRIRPCHRRQAVAQV